MQAGATKGKNTFKSNSSANVDMDTLHRMIVILQSTVNSLEKQLKSCQDANEILTQERLAYRQELFETERHNGVLAHERQALIGRLAVFEATYGERDPGTFATDELKRLAEKAKIQDEYILVLERMLSDKPNLLLSATSA